MQDNPTNIIQLIQTICKNERNASKPCDFITAEVRSVSPLKIAISDKMIVDEDFLIKTEYFNSLEINDGDSVVLIRAEGGQRFLILDKVVN